ncbi:MAG TPA: adenosine kinase [Beijerinckiaceae bacterium]|nr:adenosine kinase [Beijerinckiaceae bacterium]
MTAQFDILGIGNAIVDVIAHSDEAFLERFKVAKGSMTLIDAELAETLYAAMGPATIMSGGSGANTAAGAASFGARVAYVGKIKADAVGDIFAHDIGALGVSYTTRRAESGPPTARCFVLVTPDGERTMNTYLGACQNLSERDIDPEVVGGAKVTYLEGYLWDPPEAKKAFRKAADIAHKAGREVSLTLSDSFCVDRYRDEFRDLVRTGMVDLLFANESELKALYQTADFDTALAALRQEANKAVVTRSEKGAMFVSRAETVAVPAYPIEQLVDTTGAGDLFAAGFLHGYTAGRSSADSLRLGALAASHIIQQLGARPQVELKQLARDNGLG